MSVQEQEGRPFPDHFKVQGAYMQISSLWWILLHTEPQVPPLLFSLALNYAV